MENLNLDKNNRSSINDFQDMYDRFMEVIVNAALVASGKAGTDSKQKMKRIDIKKNKTVC